MIIEIYRFTLLNKVKQQQVLSFYDGESDFINLTNDYLSDLFQHVKRYQDAQRKDRTFSLESIQNLDVEKRIIYGSFDSGYSDDNIKIKNFNTLNTNYVMKDGDLLSRDFFYFIHIPKNAKHGFLIVQKKQNHGVKTIFERSFNQYLYKLGITDYSIELRQAPLRYLTVNYFSFGTLKRINLFKNYISHKDSSYNDFFIDDSIVLNVKKGSQSKVIMDLLISAYNNNYKDSDKINFINKGEFDEISFVVEMGDSIKTFYVKDKSKIRSTMDISSLIEDKNRDNKFDAIKEVCFEIINQAS